MANLGNIHSKDPATRSFEFAWKMVLSLLAVVSMLPLGFSNLSATLPVGVEAKAGIGYVVRELPGLPLPEGLQEDDVLALQQIDSGTRAAVIIDSNLRSGVVYALQVYRGGSLHEVPVKTVINVSRVATLARISAYPLLLGVLALGLLTLWRGRDWAAWGLTLFALGICTKQLFEFWPTDAMTSLWCYFGDRLMTCCVVIPGLYIAVDALAGAALPRKLRLFFRIVFISLMIFSLTISVVKTIGIVFYAWTGWIDYARWLNLPGVMTVLLPLLLMLIAYRRNDAARRLRPLGAVEYEPARRVGGRHHFHAGFQSCCAGDDGLTARPVHVRLPLRGAAPSLGRYLVHCRSCACLRPDHQPRRRRLCDSGKLCRTGSRRQRRQFPVAGRRHACAGAGAEPRASARGKTGRPRLLSPPAARRPGTAGIRKAVRIH